jgi:predicted ATPase/class 3 adenylate cyclase/transcriptional regulator with XRE-family HTH domain
MPPPSTNLPAPASFGDLLRRYRQAAGLTQAELAERAGLSVRGVNDLERGARRTPRRDTVALLAEALGLVGDEHAAFAAAARRAPEPQAPSASSPDTPHTLGAPAAPAALDAADMPEAPATHQAHLPHALASASPLLAALPLPSGTVTFLFTDIEGSTHLLQQLGTPSYAAVRAEYERLLRAAVTAHDGREVDTAGDGCFVVFARAPDAAAAAAEAQRALATHAWPADAVLRVRMGLHTGIAQLVGDRYVGLDVHRAARIAAAGHGGQVLLSHVVYELVRDELPVGVMVRDLGTHRLRDLQRSEQVYQLVAPDLPSDFPPLRSLEVFPHNLPIQLTSFIGREHELAEITRLLSTARLVTLTGSGGCGKTRLALQVAADLLERFDAGVWLVELAPLADPGLVPQAVASTVGVREEPGRQLLTTLVEQLRAKHLLLVLDNCEHLIGACAHLADALLRACPQLTMLASSREALGIAGERPFRVPSLGMPKAGQTQSVTQLAACEAVRLLVERATVVQPAFALTEQNAAAVAQVCRQLDGIPLALELAAARMRVLTVEQVAQRLDDRFHLLTVGSRTALPRQQTLRALIDWSYDLLPEAERTLLRRLAVFVGGWTLEAAEGVCSGDGLEQGEVLDLLTGLVDQSLVLVEGQQQGAARYRLLETVRQYASEKLLEAEAEPMRDRHLAWFLALAEEVISRLGSVDQYAWAQRLAAEYDNLQAALEWSRAQASETEVELRLVSAMIGLWMFVGHLSAGRAALEKALARSNPTARTKARARALSAAGGLAGMQMDIAAAVPLLRESVAIYRELGEKPELANALSTLGVVAMHQGDEGAARSLQAESMALLRETGQRWQLASALFLSGDTALERGEYARAREQLEESLALFRDLGDRWMGSSPLTSLGRLACVEGDYATARALVEEGLTMRREVGVRWAVAISLNSLGEVARCAGDDERAAPLFEEALARNRELSDHAGISWSLHNLGHIVLQAGDLRQAVTLFAESLTIRMQGDYKVGVAAGLAGIAGAALRLGHLERAARLFGAVAALLASLHAVLAPADKLVYDRDVDAVRTQLDDATFVKVWAAGHTMTLEEAIAEALDDTVG